MDGKAVAWLAYVPVPGLHLVPLLAARGDRFARFHALQGGVLVSGLYLLLLAVGAYAQARGGAPVEAAIPGAAVLLAGLAGVATGLAACAAGRYWRIRPAWDLAVLWL